MKRLTFLKTTGTAGLFTLITPTSVIQAMRHAGQDALEESFKNPPSSAKPFTWWHWMNGNISKEGITLDLEAMKRVGIGGVQCFNVGAGIPKGPVEVLSPEWVELTRHAINEAGRLGLEFDMHNCPGWSSTGGPWVTPELSMQQVVWSETLVDGGKQVNTALPKPFSKLDFYKDTYVIAFPSLDGEKQTMQQLVSKASNNKGTVDISSLSTADLSNGVDVTPADENAPGYLSFEFAQPFEARSILVYSAPITGSSVTSKGIPANTLLLESSNDGTTFTKVAEIKRAGANIEMLAISNFDSVQAKYFRVSVPQATRIAGVKLSPAARIVNWTSKVNFPGAGGAGGANNGTSSILQAVLFETTAIINTDAVIDVTPYMDKNGQLNWQAPVGNWTILRMGHTAIGRKNNAAPDSGAGLETDKYSKEAYDYHFNKMFENLLPDLKQQAAKGKVGLLVDSYEVGMQNWTPKLPEEFKQRRGYDFVKYLPAFTGRVVGSVDTTERFLWDLRRTHADMMADNYQGHFAELCKKNGMLAYTEPYNNAPFEEMQAGSKVNINMGEFWIRGPHFYPSVKLAASIAHVYGQRVDGKQIVGAESFTGDNIHSKWQEYPYAMKAHGDYMYTKGLNRFIFHRYAHQPHPTALPGMTMGTWGFHFDRTNTWFEKSNKWLEYAARCQSVLQQGNFVADILYYTGDDAPGEDFSMMYTPNPAPPKGYDYDFINNEALLDRVDISNGRITLPDGVSYRVMVVPARRTMTVEVLRKLAELVDKGMILIGNPPAATPGLSTGSDEELKRLTSRVWGDFKEGLTAERSVGFGKVFFNQSIQDVFDNLNIKPDFEASAKNDAAINYIHRTIGNGEVYFVANRRRRKETVVATFRVTGKQPELWNADTGEIIPLNVYTVEQGRTKVPLQFEPSGSMFVVFRSPASNKNLSGILKDGNSIVSTKTYAISPVGKYADVTNNFTIAAWVKPESEENWTNAIGVGRGPASNVFYAPEGETLYGANHAACGLIAARNGFLVYERTTGAPGNVLQATTPISGWSHVALVYNNGAPSIYLNGKLVKQATASGKVVHPGLDEAPQDRYAWFFEGDASEPLLYKEVLSESRLQELAKGTYLKPEETFAVELGRTKGGLLFWQDGKYSLQNNAGQSMPLQITGTSKPTEITGAWTVSFPPGLGAPAQVTLPTLVSLHNYPHDGVKYFSGTAAYTKKFIIPANAIAANKRLYIDLGRVEVLADVKVNGKSLGILWKPPYRVDITNVAKAGENNLEVAVTNQWVNRLIGDEQLPAENEYGSTGGATGTGGNTTGAIRKLPDWYVQGKPKPAGGRVTFTTWKHYTKDAPLIEAGLIGPVVLRTAVLHKLT
jgi:hypothetical protein